MGFEQKVPPVPDRQKQLQAIERLETSWLSQPYYKYYMNESVRKPKMELANKINKARSEYFFNCLLYGVALLPIVFFSKRFFVSRGGLPYTNAPNYFNKIRTDKQAKYISFYKVVPATYLTSVLILAHFTTNYEPVRDMNYDYVAKPPKML